MKPNTTDDQLRAGDVIIVHGTADGEPVESAKAVSFVYSTFPVLASYNDGQGNAATFSYPRQPCPSAGGPSGNRNPCPSPIRAGPSGDVILRLEFWRPQRRRLEGDPGAGRWMDVGGLSYARAGGLEHRAASGDRPSAAPRAPTPNLDSGFARDTAQQAQKFGLRWVDPSADRPASADNSFGLTLNLTRVPGRERIHGHARAAPCSSTSGRSNTRAGGGLDFTQSGTAFQLQP